MLVPGTLQELFSQGCCRPCWFPRHGGSCVLGGAVGYVGSRGMTGAVGLGLHRPWFFPGHGGSCGPGAVRRIFCCQGMAGAVGPRHLPARLVPRAWRERCARGCCRPCWFPGHGGSCGLGGAVGYVCSRGMMGAVGLGLHRPWCFPGHDGSCGLGTAPAMVLPGAWWELWA